MLDDRWMATLGRKYLGWRSRRLVTNLIARCVLWWAARHLCPVRKYFTTAFWRSKLRWELSVWTQWIQTQTNTFCPPRPRFFSDFAKLMTYWRFRLSISNACPCTSLSSLLNITPDIYCIFGIVFWGIKSLHPIYQFVFLTGQFWCVCVFEDYSFDIFILGLMCINRGLFSDFYLRKT